MFHSRYSVDDATFRLLRSELTRFEAIFTWTLSIYAHYSVSAAPQRRSTGPSVVASDATLHGIYVDDQSNFDFILDAEPASTFVDTTKDASGILPDFFDLSISRRCVSVIFGSSIINQTTMAMVHKTSQMSYSPHEQSYYFYSRYHQHPRSLYLQSTRLFERDGCSQAHSTCSSKINKHALTYILTSESDPVDTSLQSPIKTKADESSVSAARTKRRRMSSPYDGRSPSSSDENAVKKKGSKYCMVEGCMSRAKHARRCWKHGGSVKCKVPDCVNRAKTKGVCWSHGGGTLCSFPDCSTISVSNGVCWAHGGGKRCAISGCSRPAYERTDHLCALHFEEKKYITQLHATRSGSSPSSFA